MIPASYDVVRQTLLVLLPEILIMATAVAMMTAGAFVRLPRRTWAVASAATIGVALVALLALWGRPTEIYSAVALNDPLSSYARLVFLLTGLVLLALAHDQVDDPRAAEFFGCFLLITAGAMLVAAANEMVFLFVGLELVSIPTYLLLYLSRRTPSTLEAATKYFYLSIFSSALFLFGLAYLYGLSGVSNLKALGYLIEHAPPSLSMPQFGLIAVVFVTAGLGFRAAAVPFHFYAPDVYQGSPTVIAATLSWVPKGVGFVAMIRLLTAVVGGENPVSMKAFYLAWIVAAVSMTLGNAVALLQDNLKRLLAYSSIAHAGYLMIAVTAAFRNAPGSNAAYLGSEAILFYLFAYALMTLGAFGVIIALSTPERPVETVDDLAGLVRSHPWYASAMAACLFSLAGVPPAFGFWGKLAVFTSALSVGNDDQAGLFQILAVIGVLNAAIGAYYYLRIVVLMFLQPPAGPPIEARAPWPIAAAVAACASLSLVLGPFPPISRAARNAAKVAIAHPDPLPPSAPVKAAVADRPPALH